MPYTVVYDKDAENRLMDIWMQAPNPRAVAIASDDIDRRLKQSPDRSGQPFGSHRRLVVYPLAVAYTVRRGLHGIPARPHGSRRRGGFPAVKLTAETAIVSKMEQGKTFHATRPHQRQVGIRRPRLAAPGRL